MKPIFYLTLALTISLLMPLLSQAACNSAIPLTRPDSRYTLNGDGTTTDTVTGLTWMRCSLGQSWDGSSCTGTASIYNWSTALTTAENYSFAGSSDWRLPNLKELASITEKACYNPAINEAIFPATIPSTYWSSSPYASYYYYAWYVYFANGLDGSDYKNDGGYVRLVRGGQ